MRDPFLDKLREAIRAELTLRSGLTPDRVRALLVARFMRCGVAGYEEISDILNLPYERVGPLVKPLSERGEARKGGGLLTIMTGFDRSNKYVELTGSGHALCDRLDRLDPGRSDPSIESVLSVLSAFQEAVPGCHLRDLVLLIDLGEAGSDAYTRHPFPVIPSHVRRLRNAGVVGRSERPRRHRYEPPPLTEKGRALLRRMAGLNPSAIRELNDAYDRLIILDDEAPGRDLKRRPA